METTSISFVEAISRVHKALLKDLHRLEEQVVSGSDDVLPIVIARLERTQNHLAEHFRYEERDGYMEAVRKREPRLERAIEQLGSEKNKGTFRILRDLHLSLKAVPTAPGTGRTPSTGAWWVSTAAAGPPSTP